VWDAIGKRWPVADDEPAWRHAGFQPINWAERGAGLPSAHQSLEQYVDASQSYQADLVRYAAEHLRTRKFESCWGAFAYHLVDPFPGIGFGLLDGARRPKLALEALAEAFRPTRLIIEPLAFEGARPFGVLQNPDVPFAAFHLPPKASTGSRHRSLWRVGSSTGPSFCSRSRRRGHLCVTAQRYLATSRSGWPTFTASARRGKA
jgi:hypothetical protein